MMLVRDALQEMHAGLPKIACCMHELVAVKTPAAVCGDHEERNMNVHVNYASIYR